MEACKIAEQDLENVGEAGVMVKFSANPGSNLASQGLEDTSRSTSDRAAFFCSTLEAF